MGGVISGAQFLSSARVLELSVSSVLGFVAGGGEKRRIDALHSIQIIVCVCVRNLRSCCDPLEESCVCAL